MGTFCIALLLLGTGCPAALARPAKPVIRGMALGHYTDIRTPALEKMLKELVSLGASHVSLVVSWSMHDVRSTKIGPRKDYTTYKKVLKRMISRAHANGLKVILFPIIDVQNRKPLEWRGTIKPKSWDDWWRSYRRFIHHYAEVAARGGVEVFCVGSELVSTEKMHKRWTKLISGVRKVYRGKLLYSANWDHYEPVSFWKLVDVVGLTAYYSLAKRKDADEETMLRAWKQVRDRIAGWARRIDRRVLFTEVGYPSLDGGAVHPWDYTQGTRADMEEQRRAFSAFVRAWDGVKELEGVVFWDWYGAGGPKDKRYTPRKKPAEEVIRRWFKKLAPKKLAAGK
ncbi:MAG: glycoside hydrolase TIM-barrel-like domain-containing protein [Deltaproteobacteria bacterium]|nr:glycoside hydrolase TIM-barrel-like domain-containing protein [Deltaproteobacteria bacterium]